MSKSLAIGDFEYELTAMEFSNVTAAARANVYFDGNVVSHGIVLEDGSRKTFGLIYPGSYHFGTKAAERMDIIDGACKVTIDGSEGEFDVASGSFFEVSANSGFTSVVEGAICQYVCSFISE